ncbi:MAG TPA: hypothetical protein VNW23_00695 [Opitutaceae bacterium]|jgi:hypothetical protein|nr:hypothetical protein [Opitutaceae bacterium]
MSQPPPDKVTLEDLLRLKRSEQPPAEFWAQFDRELHAKQLAALVGKRPWWHSSLRVLRRFSYLPLGATAALVFAFIAAHESLAPATEIIGSNVRVSQPQTVPALAHAAVVVPVPQPVTVEAQAKTVSVDVAAVQPASHPVVSAAAPAAPTAISWLPSILQTTGNTTFSSHSLSASFADAHMADLNLGSSLASVGNVKVHSAADPLTQVSPPSETRHARFLAALTDSHLASAVDPIVAAHMHQRYASSLGDEGFADDIGRLDASGDHVSFKF